MRQVLLYSVLLVVGLVGSQFLPFLGESRFAVAQVVEFLCMVGLGFIMIHVGYEFEVDRSNLRSYGWDYIVAMTAAAFPWIFAASYFVILVLPPDAWSSWQAWKEALLAGRFAAPTSAGVLFSMLAAAGLAATWVYRKTRVLAIFDDLDTVLLMIPLKIMLVGWAWPLALVVLVMGGMLWVGWKYWDRLRIPSSWPWVLTYAVIIAAGSELIYWGTKLVSAVPVHIEVLLPAFILGCMIPPMAHEPIERPGHQPGPEAPGEQRVALVISALFMVLVGLSMPAVFGGAAPEAADAGGTGDGLPPTLSGAQPMLSWPAILLHVLAITVLSNLGKMFPVFCYRRVATWQERLAVSIAMWPRGEVGAGVLILSVGYGIGGPIVTIAMLSLAVNLVLTGLFIVIVKRLIAHAERAVAARGGVVRP